MRARLDASPGVPSARLSARQLRSLALLPAVVATAAAIHAPAALALSSDQRWQGKGASQAVRPLLPDAVAAGHNHAFDGDSPAGVQPVPPRCRGAHSNAFALALASFARGFRASEPAIVGGAWPHCRGAPQPQSNWRLASLGPDLPAPDPSTAPDRSDSSIHWRASASCLASPLRAILERVADEFGPLTVNSTCRSRRHNARVGGAPRSYHLTGNAVDFRVRSQYGDVLAFLRRLGSVGGLKHYGSGVFHIDTGPRRTWSSRLPRRG